ncbi:hypothetical protein MRX96_010663 [Rhipicephalus microplus]
MTQTRNQWYCQRIPRRLGRTPIGAIPCSANRKWRICPRSGLHHGVRLGVPPLEVKAAGSRSSCSAAEVRTLCWQPPFSAPAGHGSLARDGSSAQVCSEAAEPMPRAGRCKLISAQCCAIHREVIDSAA